MNISPVSFRASSFESMVNKPQAYQKQEVPAAATSLSKSPKKEGSAGKKFLGLVAVAAAATAGIAYAAKAGKLNPVNWKDGGKIKAFFTKEGNEKFASALGNVEKFGKNVGDKAIHVKDAVVKKCQEFVKKAPEKAEELKDQAQEAVKNTAENIQNGAGVWKAQENLDSLKKATEEHSNETKRIIQGLDEVSRIVREKAIKNFMG